MEGRERNNKNVAEDKFIPCNGGIPPGIPMLIGGGGGGTRTD